MGGIEGAFRDTLTELVGTFADRVRITVLTTPSCHASFDWLGDGIDRYRVFADPTADFDRALPAHDVLWCPFFELDPPRSPIPAVVTIPDLQHVALPECFERADLAERLRKLRPSAAYAARVLTNSEHSKRDLLRAYHLPDEHVVVTHLDCARAFREPSSRAAVKRVRERHGLPSQFALFPANAWPHKNHRGLFLAWATYRERYGPPPLLVLTGVPADRSDWLHSELVTHGLGELVLHLGYVDSADMPALYDAATMVVFPSLFEGFGIPVVEAMRRGRPLIASNAASIPEVAGDSAWLVDPRDPRALAEAVHAVLADPEAASARAAQGPGDAARFDYRRTAEQSLAVFESVATEAWAPRTAAVAKEALPRVFVVTPSFNQGRFLRATIDSVLAQDYPALDYFVADGGSTDESIEILRSYGDRIAWKSESDGGQAAAIHAAWRASDAEVVAWLNSDDVYLPGAVPSGVRHLLDHPELGMVYGKAWYTDIEGRLTEPYPTRPEFTRETFAGNCYICQPATFVRREVFEVVDLPDASLQFAMDYDLWIRLSEWFEVGYLDEFLATSRMYDDNKTLGQRDGVYREIHEVVRKHFGRVDRDWRIGYLDHRVRKVVGKVARALPRSVQQLCYRGAVKYRAWRQARPVEVPRPADPYPDGWVPPLCRVLVQPAASGVCRLRAESPEWPYADPLSVVVEFEGQVIGEAVVHDRGPFVIEVAAPRAGLRGAELVLRAQRGFVPADCGLGADPRTLAFRLPEFAR